MNFPKYNIVVLGISCFEGMAGSKRVRNLIGPLIDQNLVTANNLVFKEEIKGQIPDRGIIDNITYKVINYRLINIFSIFSFYYNGIKFIGNCRKQSNFNFIYNYGGPNIQNILFIIYAKLIGYKVICDITEDNRYEPTVNFLNKLKNRSGIFLLKASIYFADSLIGISEHLYYGALEFSKGKIPVYHIPISVDLKYFNNHTYVKTNEDFKIFYGGSYQEKDGLDFLIDAFDKVSEKYGKVTLILTGSGIVSDMQRVMNKINNSNNKRNIIFKGFLNNSDYFSLLNECDIFCMTRIKSNHANSGFPFKLGEFLASGKAVIATNVGDVSKYLTNDLNALLIEPNSVQKLADAILSLIRNPEKIISIGEKGRKTAERFFDSEIISLKFFAVLQSV